MMYCFFVTQLTQNKSLHLIFILSRKKHFEMHMAVF